MNKDARVMYKPTEAERPYALQFRHAPDPPYSLELQRILDFFRSEIPIKGKYALVCTKPHQEWKLCRLTGVRGNAVEILNDHVFDDQREAEWQVFRARWKQVVGTELE